MVNIKITKINDIRDLSKSELKKILKEEKLARQKLEREERKKLRKIEMEKNKAIRLEEKKNGTIHRKSFRNKINNIRLKMEINKEFMNTFAENFEFKYVFYFNEERFARNFCYDLVSDVENKISKSKLKYKRIFKYMKFYLDGKAHYMIFTRIFPDFGFSKMNNLLYGEVSWKTRKRSYINSEMAKRQYALELEENDTLRSIILDARKINDDMFTDKEQEIIDRKARTERENERREEEKRKSKNIDIGDNPAE